MPGKRGRVPRIIARERENRAWELKQALWTNERIAKELGVDPSAISKMIIRVNKRVTKIEDDRLTQHRYQQIDQLQRIADEAIQAWERSKESERTVIQTKPQGGQEVITVKMKDADGDPRYLNAAMNALADLRKLIGLDAPQRYVSEATGGVLDKVSEEERFLRLERLLEAARERKRDKSRKDEIEDETPPRPFVIKAPDEKSEIIQ